MNYSVVTLFPNVIEGFLTEGLLSSARAKGLISIRTVNPRDYAFDVHRTVDDRAFGGSDGMVMKPEPLAAAVSALKGDGDAHVVVLSPQGRPFTQALAEEWVRRQEPLILVCGRYAGIDQRFIDECADEVVSVGDYVLNGGEVAALAIIETTARLVPGVLGNERSARSDSFNEQIFEAPQFTRPREWGGYQVPSVLLSGDHRQIEIFNRAVGLVRAMKFRPDLLNDQSRREIPEALDFLKALSDEDLKAVGLERSDLAVSNRDSSK